MAVRGESMQKTARSPEEQWPGVLRAYDFVLPSYQIALARFEAADSRLQTLLGLILAVSTALPVLSGGVARFSSAWFVAAMCFGLASIVWGAVERTRGQFSMVNPGVLYERWLDKSEWQFKKDALFFANEHLEKNANTVERKSNVTRNITILFFVEVALLLAWIATAYPNVSSSLPRPL